MSLMRRLLNCVKMLAGCCSKEQISNFCYQVSISSLSPKRALIISKILRPCLYGEKLSRVEGSLAYPSYPGRANFSYISLQNLVNRLHEKQKVGSSGRMTCLAGSPFFDGRVTLLAGPTFLHINTLAHLAGSTPSRRDN